MTDKKKKQLSKQERDAAFLITMGTYSHARRVISPNKETRLAKAWKIAAKDLGIEFISPYAIIFPEGMEVICSGLIPHFGSPKGTLIISGLQDPDPEKAWNATSDLGFYGSALNPVYYENYRRSNFISTLRDWEWYGPKDKQPFWHLSTEPCSQEALCEKCRHLQGLMDPSICSPKKLCPACKFYKQVPYWLNTDWKRRQRKLKNLKNK